MESKRSITLPTPLLAVVEVAEVLGVSERTVRRLIADGRLKVIRIGRSVRVSQAVLKEVTGDDSWRQTNVPQGVS